LAVKRDIESGDLEDAVEKLNAINPEVQCLTFSCKLIIGVDICDVAFLFLTGHSF